MTIGELIQQLERAKKLNPKMEEGSIFWDGETEVMGGIAAERDGKPVLILAPERLNLLPGGF